MLTMGTALEEGAGYVEYLVPTRGMIGLRNAMLTATRGMAVMESSFHSYRPNCGPISSRDKGSLLAFETGEATTFGIMGAQDRGQMFIDPKTKVYVDMIIGVHQRPGDLKVNVCKTKALTNMRSAGKDKDAGIQVPLELTLDSAVEYIADDELVEVTPESIRMCKRPGWDKRKSSK
jgi:GTP-binding protein